MSNARTILFAVCGAGFLFQADITALSAIILDLSADLRNHTIDPAWVMDIYSLALIFALPIAGALADRLGRHRLFVAGAALFGASSCLCALAPSFPLLLLFRGAQGASGALLTSAAAGLLAQLYEGQARRNAFAILGTVIGASMIVGPPLGSLFAQTIGWRWLFWVNLPGSAVIISLVWRERATVDHVSGRPIDWAGSGLFALGTAILCFGLLEAKHLADQPIVLLAVLIMASICFYLFARVERSTNFPALDLKLLASPRFLAICLVPIASSISYWSLLVYVPQYARGPLALSVAETGWLLTCLTIPMLLLPRVGARLAGKLRPANFFALGLFIIAMADLALGLVSEIRQSAIATGGLLFLAGVGSALINAQISGAAVAVVSNDQAAMASAINTVMRQFGFALGIAILGMLLDFIGFPAVFYGAAAIGTLLAVACGLLLKRAPMFI